MSGRQTDDVDLWRCRECDRLVNRFVNNACPECGTELPASVTVSGGDGQ